MDTGIGATLREARNRRKLDLSEVEAAIKIRVRYLQAMENEEWDALPGGAYTRGFVRTYALYLGLDGERLADDYRRSTAPPAGERAPKRVEPMPTGRRERSPIPGWVLASAVSLALIALAVGIGLTGGSDDEVGSPGSKSAASGGERAKRGDRTTAAAATQGVEVELAATAEVWVCLLDAREEPLVEGEILEEGAEAGPFRSKGFEIALGNGSVAMLVDGKQAEIPASSSPVGYEIDASGKLTALEEGERPDCE
ncbi:MAG: helix-turn-helix domain-containing protein [Solirubrobacterales bacterium]